MTFLEARDLRRDVAPRCRCWIMITLSDLCLKCHLECLKLRVIRPRFNLRRFVEIPSWSDVDTFGSPEVQVVVAAVTAVAAAAAFVSEVTVTVEVELQSKLKLNIPFLPPLKLDIIAIFLLAFIGNIRLRIHVGAL